MADQGELHARGMDPAAREPDDGRDGGQRGRAQRPVRHAQGELRHRQRAGADQDGRHRERAGQGRGRRLRDAEGRSAARDGLKAKLAGGKATDIKATATATLRQVAALLAAKAPEDAAPFKAWLAQISQNVAESASEGGFLGFGGVQVSDAEKATLGEIAEALNLPA